MKSQKSLLDTSSTASVHYHLMVLSIPTHIYPSAAKVECKLYTLKPTAAMVLMPPQTSDTPTAMTSRPPPAAGPVRTQHNSTQAQMQTGPMTPALKAHILENIAKAASKASDTQAGATQVIIPTEAELIMSIKTKPILPAEAVQPSQSTLTNDPLGNQQLPPSMELFDDNMSDSFSFTSTLSDVFEVRTDDSGPLATGPWTIIDHFTGEMAVNDEEVPPTSPIAPGAPLNSTIQVKVILNTAVLIQTPLPTLLFTDQDVHPNWLIISTNEFLQHVPY